MAKTNSDRECRGCPHAIKDHRPATKATKHKTLTRNVLKCKIPGCDCVRTLSFEYTKTIKAGGEHGERD